MATALLVEFDPSNYHDHMQRWANWVMVVSGGGVNEAGWGQSMPTRSGFYKGGPENILRQKPYSARGKQTESRGVKHHYPEGHDTEYAINMAVAALTKESPEQSAAVEEQFLRRGSRQEKADRLGVSLGIYKHRIGAAQAFICGYMQGTKYRSEKINRKTCKNG